MHDRAGMLAEAAGMVMAMPMRLVSYVLLCRVVERLPGAHSVGRRVVKWMVLLDRAAACTRSCPTCTPAGSGKSEWSGSGRPWRRRR